MFAAILIFFLYDTKDNMLVIIYAKFEINSCCGWDFRQGGGGKLTPLVI